MLSESNEIQDIKALVHTYSEYGIDDDSAFTTILEDCIELVKNTIMLSALSEGCYDEIAAKDKDGLTRDELLIYQAEVRFAAGEFLNRIGNLEEQRKDTESKSISFGGVSFSYNGKPSKYKAANMLINDGYKYLSLAGYRKSASISRYGTDNRWNYSISRLFS